jgi:Site-specific recombinase XerD
VQNNALSVQGPAVPLERLVLPPSLDGRNGTNRLQSSGARQIEAENDLEAIYVWLREFQDSPHTFRSYRKEIERLLLWSLLERGKSMSSLTREDLAAYQAFLADPQPRSRWCGPKVSRFSTDWRPFQGPLRLASQHQALIIINALFTYLVSAGYLEGNPLALVRRRARVTGGARLESVERFLEQDLWQYLMEFVEALPQQTQRQRAHYERVRFIFSLLYLLGPRVSEVTSHSMGSFIERRGKWWWRVTGKGGKMARIPVNQDMMNALARYRTFLGLSSVPVPDEKTPLVLSLNGTQGITANMVYRIVKDVLRQAADNVSATQPHKAEKLRKASTHWFRHTAITHQADANIELRYLNKSARHSKLETTAIYLHTDEDAWHEAMEKHKLKE